MVVPRQLPRLAVSCRSVKLWTAGLRQQPGANRAMKYTTQMQILKFKRATATKMQITYDVSVRRVQVDSDVVDLVLVDLASDLCGCILRLHFLQT